MGTVWKFPLDIADGQTITAPTDATVLHLAMQDGRPCLWLLVDPTKERVEMKIKVIGTGWSPVDTTTWQYIGTVLENGGRLVWHCFWDRAPL
jgi:hypothetical protein